VLLRPSIGLSDVFWTTSLYNKGTGERDENRPRVNRVTFARPKCLTRARARVPRHSMHYLILVEGKSDVRDVYTRARNGGSGEGVAMSGSGRGSEFGGVGVIRSEG
jgi:hypothetical protein